MISEAISIEGTEIPFKVPVDQQASPSPELISPSTVAPCHLASMHYIKPKVLVLRTIFH